VIRVSLKVNGAVFVAMANQFAVARFVFA